jgi:hypothetical protein
MKYLIVTFLLSNMAWSQNFKMHLWKNRVIVISADRTNYELLESQFNLLNAEKEKLIDRKIVLYKCKENTCAFYNFKQEPKMTKTNSKIVGFSVALIGLDGGEKYKSKKEENPDVFFDLIDTMPMRKHELNRERNE